MSENVSWVVGGDRSGKRARRRLARTELRHDLKMKSMTEHFQSNDHKDESQIVRIACVVAYDGTDFEGFQTQRHGRTIQDALEARLSRLLMANNADIAVGDSPTKRFQIYGAGRTDAGVHALGQVFHFDLPKLSQASSFLLNLPHSGNDDGNVWHGLSATCVAGHIQAACVGNSLPSSIQVRSVFPAPGEMAFHARESCIGKRYVYTIHEGRGDPFRTRTSWVVCIHRCCL
jgi:tRNA pseudouridine38-40 synthase